MRRPGTPEHRSGGVGGCRPPLILAGIGSPYRRDDGVGLRVADRVAAERAGQPGIDNIGPIEDTFDLLGKWDGAALAVVIDAVRTGAAPGTVHVVEVAPRERPSPSGEDRRPVSSHGIGLSGVLALAAATGTAPSRVVVVGIEGQDFERGEGLTEAVERAVPRAVGTVLSLLDGAAPCA